MASIQPQVLQERTASTSAVATSSTAVTLPPRAKNLIGELVVSACHADVTVAAIIEHSSDNSNWYTYLSFSNVAGAAGKEVKHPTNQPILPYVRATTTFTGATTGKAATTSVKLHFEPN